MRRLLVNDMLSALPDHRTFWNDLQEWFDCVFIGGDYGSLDEKVSNSFFTSDTSDPLGVRESLALPSLIIRNASWFGPLRRSDTVPTISILQDILPQPPEGAQATEGIARARQFAVMESCRVTVFNSEFTRSHYCSPWMRSEPDAHAKHRRIPLPVDFSLFEPQNPMGCQQALGLPDGCVLWIGACREAGHVKGWDIFQQIVRLNPDISFVAVFKDQPPDSCPPNLRMYSRITHPELVQVIGACRVGLCTSRMESQHLAGIEMGACGLPIVAPPVGVYWNRPEIPGIVLKETNPQEYASAIRSMQRHPGSVRWTRDYWRKEFDRLVIKAQWEKLIEEVESENPRGQGS